MAPATTRRFLPISRITRSVSVMPDRVPANHDKEVAEFRQVDAHPRRRQRLIRYEMWVANGDWRTPIGSRSRLLVEAFEQALAAAEGDRGDRDRQLVDEPVAKRLADDVGTAHQRHILVPGGGPSTIDGLVEAVDEREAAILRLVVRMMGDHEERDWPRVGAAPVVGGFILPRPPTTAPSRAIDLVEVRLVLADRLAAGARFVRPRMTEDPVVEPLTALPETLLWSIVRRR